MTFFEMLHFYRAVTHHIKHVKTSSDSRSGVFSKRRTWNAVFVAEGLVKSSVRYRITESPLTTRFPEKTGKWEFDTLFNMFWPCRAKNVLLRTCLGYRREVKTEVHKMMPSKATLGGSDGRLGPPRMIFGSPLGILFGDKIQKNEVL